MHLHTIKWTTQKVSNDEDKALSVCIPFPCFPLFCLSLWISTSHLWAARTGRLHKQTREVPGRHLLTDQLEGRWFSCFVWAATRWEAHRSLESSAGSQLQQAPGASCCLIPVPDSICKLCPMFIPYMGYLFYCLYVLSPSQDHFCS